MTSFRRRLARAHLAVIVAVLGVGALAAYWGLARAVHGQLDAALLALAEAEGSMLAESRGQPARVHEVAPGPAAPSFVRLDRLVQIVGADGAVLARSANLGAARLPAPPELLSRLAAGETVFETLRGYGEEPVRLVSVPVGSGEARMAVQVAGSLDDVNHVVESASVLFMVLGLALFLAVGAAGAVLTSRAFHAIDEVVEQARRIGQSNLHKRLPHPGPHDEIGRLVDTLNEMLGRLEHGFETQRRFTADASHELRSPLSRLRTELELALRRPRDSAEYVETLRSCLEEAERLTLVVEDLLTLARTDAGQERVASETACLNRVADEAVRRLEPAARERQISVVVEASAEVDARIGAKPAQLVLANLLDNALKFTPAGGRVTVRLGAEGREAVLSVADSGPGLSVSELPYLFERFFRGSAARGGSAPGVGLGLAMSQAAVQAHGGRIEAANASGGGAVFTVRLPLAAGEG